MTKLNEQQRQFVMYIFNKLKLGTAPVRVFLNGAAGVGKSFVIHTLYHLITNFSNNHKHGKVSPDTLKVLRCAPSGKAAFNIHGSTIHSAFNLPFQCASNTVILDAESLANLRAALHDVVIIIIDEVSMLGAKVFTAIDSRLRQMTGKNESFGGISILLCGDFYQQYIKSSQQLCTVE